MTLKIIHKNSTSAGTSPAAGDVDVGEIAINAADAELYTKDTGGNIRKFQNTTTGTADGLRFTQSGSGAVERTVESKLQDVVSVKDFGALGDNNTASATSNRLAFQAALNTGKSVFVPSGTYYIDNASASRGLTFLANQTLFGNGRDSTLVLANNDSWIRIEQSNVQIKDLRINVANADMPVGIDVGVSASSTPPENISFENIFFSSGLTRIRLGNCSGITVNNCTFDNTGYCVLQLAGTISDNVLVTNCYATNIKNDFVEANCTGLNVGFTATSGQTTYNLAVNDSGNSKARYIPGTEIVSKNGSILTRGTDYTATDGVNITFSPALNTDDIINILGPRAKGWVINNNVLEGLTGFPKTGIEERFVGITGVYGVVIDGNVARNVNGDAFVHLEDLGGEVIVSNNFFENLASGNFIIGTGSRAYTWNLIVSDNIIKQTSPLLVSDTVSALYNGLNHYNELTFTGNRIIGNTGSVDFRGIFTNFHTGNKIISNNYFEKLSYAINTISVSNVLFSNNIISDCAAGIVGGNGTGTDWQVLGNVFKNTASTYDIEAEVASNPAVYAPRRWFVQGNYFAKGVRFKGAGGPGSSVEAQDIYVSGNVFASGAICEIVGTKTRTRQTNNTYQDTGSVTASVSNAIFEPAASAPSTPTDGQVYFNNSTKKLQVYNGTSWIDLH